MNAPTFTMASAKMPDGPRITAQAHAQPWRKWAEPALRDQWQKLAEGASTPNPFFEPWYLLPSLAAFDQAGDVQIVSVEIGGDLIGLMPLKPSRRYGRWPFPQLSAWLHANAFLGAPLVRNGYEAMFWQALLDWADAAPSVGQSLFLHLPAMPLDQPLTRILFDLCSATGRTAGLVMREERALLQSSLSPDQYLEAALPGKKRKELRRQHARLTEQGQLAVDRRHDASDLAEWTEAFLALERSGWKGRAGSAMASADETATLFRNALGEAARLGKLERLALTLDGHPIAMLVTFITAPGSFSYKTAFDESFARFSPGVLLQRENLALLQREGVSWCDSCAAPDHPMIDSLWTERRAVGRISVAIGGLIRRTLFKQLLALELGRNPTGITR
ncbi:GNAT family N-acetyltransferase [Novosphingobium sp. SL115]|uniref:GNAT family N-acetyltransferase n=1 Tax=Novosphingobium sp. SL115 TaxID=2995150 RepID=UPI002272C91C|nr:GNAT family N-acetyltransferase [Novosphingobium sp. SL115]MCY1672398.1 GNAT family N-acetyltransferase [Novosphingobium sp. SL115]